VKAGLELTYAALLSMAICLFAMPIARRLKVIDFPDSGRKMHPLPTPLVGGIAIMVPLILWCLARIASVHATEPNKFFVAIVLGGGAVAIAGFIDDQRYVSAGARLLLLAMVAAAALAIDQALIGTHIDTANWGAVAIPSWLFAALVVLALVGFPSAVNMADGVNGVVVSLFFVWALCIVFSSAGSVAASARVVAVGAAVTFLFNLRGRLFLGDCGAFGVAFALGLMTVAAHNAGRLRVETVVVWYFIPVVDCFRLMVSRRISGRSPLSPDRNHFHHRLAQAFGAQTARWAYVGLVVISSTAATFAPQFDDIYLGLLAISYVVLLRPDLVGWRPRALPISDSPSKALRQDVAVRIIPAADGRPAQRQPTLKLPHDEGGNKTLQ
jgi:UDP-GlcNAc:undecaprenyl-phosphate GlcNAc-1-phosphate transferase